MELPPILLDRAAPVPLAVQVADALRAATTLRVGDRLPSTRALAAALGVSRTVTAAAYDQLLAEGWVVGRRGAGTYVAALPPVSAEGGSSDPPHSRAAKPQVDLRPGVPCVEVLDRAAWRRAWRAAADDPPDVGPDPVGLPAFRAAAVEHLLRHRGVAVGADDLLATAGSTTAVGEIARVLPPGARVAVEEPGYQRAVGALRAAGLTVVGVPVDDAGLVVDALPDGLAAVYCTPAHQFPLGARLAAGRRVALLERARQRGFLVIEDDYDGELRYDVAPLPLLAALGPDVVVHLGTTSKLLTPTLGAGWLVGPPEIRSAVLALRERTGARPGNAGQRVVAALAAHGDLARHVRRLRRELGARRASVLAALDRMPVRGDAAGAHLLVPLPDAAAERAAVAAAAERGVALDGLARHHAGRPTGAGIVLGYAGPPRAALDRALGIVAAALTSTMPAG